MPCPRGLPDKKENMDTKLEGKALSDWLQTYHWDYFLTVTTRWPRRDAISFMRDINAQFCESETSLWSNPDRIYLPGRIFLACEPHRYRGSLHAHGLLAGLPGLYPPKVFQKALDLRFGRSRVERCRNQSYVAGYCAKYVTKITDGDNYDFFGQWGLMGDKVNRLENSTGSKT